MLLEEEAIPRAQGSVLVSVADAVAWRCVRDGVGVMRCTRGGKPSEGSRRK